uniref:Uncharacterized protein n=1 Tax=Cacopsylla melanoneura TaxID=428564 RepID=A0A8D9B727_9HEMI
MSYGTRGRKDKLGDATPDKAQLTLVNAVAQSKQPVEVLLISHQLGSVDGTELTDEDNSLSSYVEDNKLVPADKDQQQQGTGKNIIALKEKNTNLVKLITSLAQTYSIQVKQIVPLEDIPSDQKVSVIRNIVKVNELNQDPCYVIVVNGDEAAISEILAIRGLSVTRVGKETKALNSLEKQQIEELKKKLNRTETAAGGGAESLETPKECSTFRLYVF